MIVVVMIVTVMIVVMTMIVSVTTMHDARCTTAQTSFARSYAVDRSCVIVASVDRPCSSDVRLMTTMRHAVSRMSIVGLHSTDCAVPGFGVWGLGFGVWGLGFG